MTNRFSSGSIQRTTGLVRAKLIERVEFCRITLSILFILPSDVLQGDDVQGWVVRAGVWGGRCGLVSIPPLQATDRIVLTNVN